MGLKNMLYDGELVIEENSFSFSQGTSQMHKHTDNNFSGFWQIQEHKVSYILSVSV